VVLEVPSGGDLEGAAVAAFSSHANAFARCSRVPERRLAVRADPLAAAVVPFLLLAQALLGELLQRLAIPLLEQLELFWRQRGLALLCFLEPVEQLRVQIERRALDAFEVLRERLVERVEVRLAVYEQRARDPVKAVERAVVQALLERSSQRQCL